MTISKNTDLFSLDSMVRSYLSWRGCGMAVDGMDRWRTGDDQEPMQSGLEQSADSVPQLISLLKLIDQYFPQDGHIPGSEYEQLLSAQSHHRLLCRLESVTMELKVIFAALQRNAVARQREPSGQVLSTKASETNKTSMLGTSSGTAPACAAPPIVNTAGGTGCDPVIDAVGASTIYYQKNAMREGRRKKRKVVPYSPEGTPGPSGDHVTGDHVTLAKRARKDAKMLKSKRRRVSKERKDWECGGNVDQTKDQTKMPLTAVYCGGLEEEDDCELEIRNDLADKQLISNVPADPDPALEETGDCPSNDPRKGLSVCSNSTTADGMEEIGAAIEKLIESDFPDLAAVEINIAAETTDPTNQNTHRPRHDNAAEVSEEITPLAMDIIDTDIVCFETLTRAGKHRKARKKLKPTKKLPQIAQTASESLVLPKPRRLLPKPSASAHRDGQNNNLKSSGVVAFPSTSTAVCDDNKSNQLIAAVLNTDFPPPTVNGPSSSLVKAEDRFASLSYEIDQSGSSLTKSSQSKRVLNVNGSTDQSKLPLQSEPDHFSQSANTNKLGVVYDEVTPKCKSSTAKTAAGGRQTSLNSFFPTGNSSDSPTIVTTENSATTLHKGSQNTIYNNDSCDLLKLNASAVLASCRTDLIGRNLCTATTVVSDDISGKESPRIVGTDSNVSSNSYTSTVSAGSLGPNGVSYLGEISSKLFSHKIEEGGPIDNSEKFIDNSITDYLGVAGLCQGVSGQQLSPPNDLSSIRSKQLRELFLKNPVKWKNGRKSRTACVGEGGTKPVDRQRRDKVPKRTQLAEDFSVLNDDINISAGTRTFPSLTGQPTTSTDSGKSRLPVLGNNNCGKSIAPSNYEVTPSMASQDLFDDSWGGEAATPMSPVDGLRTGDGEICTNNLSQVPTSSFNASANSSDVVSPKRTTIRKWSLIGRRKRPSLDEVPDELLNRSSVPTTGKQEAPTSDVAGKPTEGSGFWLREIVADELSVDPGSNSPSRLATVDIGIGILETIGDRNSSDQVTGTMDVDDSDSDISGTSVDFWNGESEVNFKLDLDFGDCDSDGDD